jgi:phosphatidylserine decarboxylase
MVGRLTDLQIPRPLRAGFLRLFARVVGIDTSEVELPLAEYPSVNRFFVRRLKPGVREIVHDPSVVVSPVDGIAGEIGQVTDGRLLQVKGHHYSVASLLDDDSAAARFDGGCFITLYLSPRHYHRIHSPCAGKIMRARHVPGGLLPVNRPSVALNPELFTRNERLVCHVDSDQGQTAVVAVGAFNVGRISAAFDREWNRPVGEDGGVSNRRGAVASTRSYDPPIEIGQGDEIMAFHLGSTVVLLLEQQRFKLLPELAPGVEVRVGQPLARLG